jgi:hypothetical protein
VRTFSKSRARLFRLIPVKSFIIGETFQLSFQFKNIGDEAFPGGVFSYEIRWPSQQAVQALFSIPPLPAGESSQSPQFISEALCEGFGLVFMRRGSFETEKGGMREVEFYRDELLANKVFRDTSIAAIKTKTWEEIYEHWALVISMSSLFIIALEKLFALWNRLHPN